MLSTISYQELSGRITANILEAMPTGAPADSLVIIGVTPRSNAARDWLGFKTYADEINLVSFASLDGPMQNATRYECDLALGRMLQAESNYYITLAGVRNGQIGEDEICYESDITGKDAAVHYIVNGYGGCDDGFDHVLLELYVYVLAGSADLSRKLAWSVEPLVEDWTHSGDDMYYSAHKPQDIA